MTKVKKILCVVGTRPEAIKMAPVILALGQRSWAEVEVLATAQHRDLLDQVLSIFRIEPDADLDIMRHNQELPRLTAGLIEALDRQLAKSGPDMVLAQGDTTTVFVAALAAFYRRIPFGHVEAGLRTGNLEYPYPEEMNRVLADRISTLHFAPTSSAEKNLLREGIAQDSIHVTGNTVIDALLTVAAREIPINADVDPEKRLILVTAHRRESFGAPFQDICRAVRELADRNPDVQILYPVHPNPNVHATAHELLGGHARILLSEPLDYGPFITAMKRSHIILTDSGGVQEEAPALGKPVLVLRAETERPEAVEEGVVRLVGTRCEQIVAAAQQLLDDADAYRSMAKGVSPYGDGKAAGRIADILEGWFESHDSESRQSR
ncbi:MAG: non-hydrolyzing UDP-N-acetylglucosamine 2-epimerase [Planctomycetota bacterium]|jgi:UDP-N-acetylglucosamine 2-epimerase (non-hydrolysing)